jgi:hypothetical protein
MVEGFIDRINEEVDDKCFVIQQGGFTAAEKTGQHGDGDTKIFGIEMRFRHAVVPDIGVPWRHTQ